jgi:uncharacterized membrane protein
MRYEVTVEADASMEKTWNAVADVEQWPLWTESMTEVHWLDDGSLTVGGRATVKQPRIPPIVWEVSEVEPGKSFVWHSSLIGAKNTGSHELAQLSPSKTAITLKIEMSGVLSGLFALMGWSRSKRYIRMEADGLKRFAEAGN